MHLLAGDVRARSRHLAMRPGQAGSASGKCSGRDCGPSVNECAAAWPGMLGPLSQGQRMGGGSLPHSLGAVLHGEVPTRPE